MQRAVLTCYNRAVDQTTITRPDRAEELRLEAESRATAGSFVYRGERYCPACDRDGEPIHPDSTDRQTCPHCKAYLPGAPVTWMIRTDDDHEVFILRSGDYCISGRAPVRSGDNDVDQVLAGNVWLNLERAVFATQALADVDD